MSEFRFKLGARPPKNAPALALGPLLTGLIPDHPTSADYLEPSGWQMLGNDRYGDCVAVMAANNRRNVTWKLGGAELYPDINWVYAVYKTQNPNWQPGGSDEGNGMDLQTLLEYFHATGTPDGTKLPAFAKVDVSNLEEIKAAIAIFGDLWIACNVQQANYDDFNAGKPWNYHKGSSIVGGHGILGGGYTITSTNDVKFITWAQKTAFTDSFWTHEVGEAWVPIWPEYFGTRAFLDGIDQAKLAAAYQALTGQVLPVPPTPVPPTPEAKMQLLPKPVRAYDGGVQANVSNPLQIGGNFGVPADAVGVVAIVRAVRPSSPGWIYVGPNQGGVPSTSTLDYEAGHTTDLTVIAGLTNGQVTLYTIRPLTRFVVDVIGFLPATA